MPDRPCSFTTSDGARIAYRFDGPADRPVLVLSNSIGTALSMWDGVIPGLVPHVRVLRYDTRGHGDSDVTTGDYSIDRLGHDVVELLDAVGVERAHFCGISLGGLVGQWLAVHAPERVDRLVLANTSPYLGPPDPWQEQIANVLAADDLSATAETFLANWLPEHLRLDEGVAGPLRRTLVGMDARGLAGCLAAVRDADLRSDDARITRPTLVIIGEHDQVCLPSHGELIAATVPGAELASLPAVHLSNVEYPQEFLALALGFLDRGVARVTEPD